MTKLRTLALLGLSILTSAGIQANQKGDLISVQRSSADNDPFTIVLSYSNGTLDMQLLNIYGMEEEITDPSTSSLPELKRSANVSGQTIRYDKRITLTDDKPTPSLVKLNEHYRFPDVDQGVFNVSASFLMERFSGFGDQHREVYEDFNLNRNVWLNITEGEYTITPDFSSLDKDSSSIFEKEWVTMTSGTDTPRFFRMRFGKSPKSISGKNLYPLYMSDSDCFKQEDAICIAWMDEKLSVLAPVDIDIPSDFWASGLTISTINPKKWNCFPQYTACIDAYKGMYQSPQLPAYNYLNYFNCFDDRFSSISIIDTETILNDDTLYSKIHISGSSASKAITPWSAEWIAGIGAIGDGYASNLPFPMYQLPSEASPTTLLYVRNLTTGKLLYGDDSRDPYAAMESVYEDSGNIQWEITSGTASVITDNPVSLSIYTSDGALIANAKGPGHATLSISSLPAGVYILKALSDKQQSSRRIIR